MFKFKKRQEERYSIKQFMDKGRVVAPVLEPSVVGTPIEFKKETVESLGWLATISTLPLVMKPFFETSKVFASESEPVIQYVPAVGEVAKSQMYDKMLHAFDPLIDLVQAVAYPIAMVVILGGSIMVMMRQPEKGFGLIQSAGLGYVLVQMTPMILNILVDAMKVM
jgi:hypothetical protein